MKSPIVVAVIACILFHAYAVPLRDNEFLEVRARSKLLDADTRLSRVGIAGPMGGKSPSLSPVGGITSHGVSGISGKDVGLSLGGGSSITGKAPSLSQVGGGGGGGGAGSSSTAPTSVPSMPCSFEEQDAGGHLVVPGQEVESTFMEMSEALVLDSEMGRTGISGSRGARRARTVDKAKEKRAEKDARHEEIRERSVAAEQTAKSTGDPSGGCGTPAAEPGKRVFVSFSGGGARAAMTSLTFAEFLADVGIMPYVEAIGGISGGSWGASWLCRAGVSPQADQTARQTPNFADTKTGVGKLLAEMERTGRQFGETHCFSPSKAAVGANSVYYAWLADVANGVFFNDDVLTTKDIWTVEDQCVQNMDLQVFVNSESPPSSRRPDKKQTLMFTKSGLTTWTAGTLNSKNTWFDDSNDQLAFVPDKSVPAQYRKLRLLDLLALSSSAWTISAWNALGRRVDLEKNTNNANYKTISMRDPNEENLSLATATYYGVHDAGIDCNVPLNPEWNVPGGLILMLDSSDGTDANSDSVGDLKQCLKYWSVAHGLTVTVHSVFAPETAPPLDSPGKASYNDATVYELRADGWNSKILYVFAAALPADGGVELIKREAPTRSGATSLSPKSFSAREMQGYLTKFKKYLYHDVLFKMATGSSAVAASFRTFATSMCASDSGAGAGAGPSSGVPMDAEVERRIGKELVEDGHIEAEKAKRLEQSRQ